MSLLSKNHSHVIIKLNIYYVMMKIDIFKGFFKNVVSYRSLLYQ